MYSCRTTTGASRTVRCRLKCQEPCRVQLRIWVKPIRIWIIATWRAFWHRDSRINRQLSKLLVLRKLMFSSQAAMKAIRFTRGPSRSWWPSKGSRKGWLAIRWVTRWCLSMQMASLLDQRKCCQANHLRCQWTKCSLPTHSSHNTSRIHKSSKEEAICRLNHSHRCPISTWCLRIQISISNLRLDQTGRVTSKSKSHRCTSSTDW